MLKVKEKLSKKIKKAISDPMLKDGFFVKLNSRSPKDCTTFDNENEKYKNYIRLNLKNKLE
eukprot:UN01471